MGPYSSWPYFCCQCTSRSLLVAVTSLTGSHPSSASATLTWPQHSQVRFLYSFWAVCPHFHCVTPFCIWAQSGVWCLFMLVSAMPAWLPVHWNGTFLCFEEAVLEKQWSVLGPLPFAAVVSWAEVARECDQENRLGSRVVTKQINICSFEGLYNCKCINTTKRKQEGGFNMLPMQAEIFHYMGFLKGTVYSSNSYKLARKDYSTYSITIWIPVLFLFCKLKHKGPFRSK